MHALPPKRSPLHPFPTGHLIYGSQTPVITDADARLSLPELLEFGPTFAY